jgi:response regulator NasT
MNKENSGRARRILAVDDDAVALAIVAEGLAGAGYEVETAPSGEAALERAGNRQFDLALVDMQMPGISGAELSRRLLADHECYSLVLSGRSDGASVQAAVRDGALGYLVKPLAIASLVPAIETALARAREIGDVNRDRTNLAIALREGRDTSVAIGILAERLRLDREAAFALLRDTSRNQRKRIVQVAESVIQSTETLNGFSRPAA